MKLPTFVASQREQGNSRKICISTLLSTLKPLTVWITTSCGQFLKRWEYQNILLVSRETCVCVKKQELEADMEQCAGSKLGKGDNMQPAELLAQF